MKKDATELRNELFEKYFEEKEGMNLSGLMKAAQPVLDVWKDTRSYFAQNMKGFFSQDGVENIKEVTTQGKNFLIVKFRIWKYLVVDLEQNEVLEGDKVKSYFDESFFIENFKEHKVEKRKDYTECYYFTKYLGDISQFLTFYKKHKTLLSLPTSIYHVLELGEAWTYLSINLTSGHVQLGFETEDQFLYEQLFFNSKLEPWAMQDATSKIGVEKMKEMFARIKEIRIPETSISSELYKVLSIFYEEPGTLDKKDNRQKKIGKINVPNNKE